MKVKTPKLKFGTELASISGCPSNDCGPHQRAAFRWVYKSLKEDSFLPVSKLQPRRRFKTSKACCSSYALSMFTTAELARKRYNQLVTDRPELKKVFGDHLAEGMLDLTDGLQSKPDRSGHFDLHEALGVVLFPKFILVGLL